MIKTIIIDSNSKDASTLEHLLSQNCSNVNICGAAISRRETDLLIKRHRPSLAFLSPEITQLSTYFELYSKLKKLGVEIILTSTCTQTICHLFKYQAGEYLIKPIQPDYLKAVIDIVQQRLTNSTSEEKVQVSLHTLANNLVGIPSIEGYDFHLIDNIIRCEGYQNSTRIITTAKSDIISSYNIGVFKKTFLNHSFFSPHKSHLINLKHIKKYYKEGSIRMSDQSVVPVSKRRKKDFLDSLLLSH